MDGGTFMKKFLDNDFLLSSNTAKRLYHDYAEGIPIVDYHCHIDPVEIADDRQYELSPMSGWEEITINGVQCAGMAYRNV